MLINEQDTNILPLGRETVKGIFNSCIVGLGVDDEEVLLRVWRLCDVL